MSKKESNIVKQGKAIFKGLEGKLFLLDDAIYFEYDPETNEFNHQIPLESIEGVETITMLSSIIVNVSDENLVYEVSNKEDWKQVIEKQIEKYNDTPRKVVRLRKSIESKEEFNNYNSIYCQTCGSKISKEAYVCPKCGVLTNGKKEKSKISTESWLSFWFGIVSMFLYFPFAFQILAVYYAFRAEKISNINEPRWPRIIGFILGVIYICAALYYWSNINQ